MIIKHLTFLSLFILIASCSKDDFSSDRNIVAWAENSNPNFKDLTQIRLAFGKSVARALGEQEFRAYIKEKSTIPGEQIYHELLFALIKDDILPSGRTVAQLIQAHEDDEVKEIFGETLMDRVANDDPMVAIKLPDLFHSMIWDTKNIIPFVGVQTPDLLPGFTYPFYYHNGYSELIKDVNAAFYEQVKYFYIMVKYSSDYLLLNTDNLTNEKNISLYEFLPQIEYCTKNILPQILTSGVRSAASPNKILLDKQKCYAIWQEHCSYTGELAYTSQNCGNDCPRNCDPDNPLNKNLILGDFEVKEDLFLFVVGILFRESANVSFDFISFKQKDLIKRFVVPNVRYQSLDKFVTTVTLTEGITMHDNSQFSVPLVSLAYKSSQTNGKRFLINALMFDDVNLENDFIYTICTNFLYYEDSVNPINFRTDLFHCFQPFFNGQKIVYPSYSTSIGSEFYSWCTGTQDLIYNVPFSIKY
mgnify:CR=1 FL=1